MARIVGLGLAILAGLGVGYLLAWPVPVAPLAWEAPTDRGLVDPFERNDRLKAALMIPLGAYEGPEDIAGLDGFIYTGTVGGAIIRLRPDGRDIRVFAETGGRPLGLEFDASRRLIVANAQLGLQSVTQDGQVSMLLAECPAGHRVHPNDVAVAKDGRIYFSESSEEFSGERFANTYDASILAIVEHGADGRVYEYDAAGAQCRVIASGLDYANGVAVSGDQQFLLISETAEYRIWRYWMDGPQRGQREIILENLPGFPDNINTGLNDRFWVGLIAPRNALIDRLSNMPWARKIILRLPKAIRPAAENSSHLIGIDGSGVVLMDLQDSRALYPSITGAYETRDALFLSTLFGNRIARLDKSNLAVP